jgi:hypothetical protein
MFLYLEPTAASPIRFLPGSQTAEAQQRLRCLQAMHGVCTASPRWARHTYGVRGEDLPARAVPSTPGDLVFFHGSMYHAVYHHDRTPGRRAINLRGSARPAGPAQLAMLWRNAPATFDFFALSEMQTHRSPLVRKRVAGMGGPEVGARCRPSSAAGVQVGASCELACSVSCGQVLAAAVEAATGAEPVAYPDADITSYEEGKTYCKRHGVRRARAVMGADTPLSPGSVSETTD